MRDDVGFSYSPPPPRVQSPRRRRWPRIIVGIASASGLVLAIYFFHWKSALRSAGTADSPISLPQRGRQSSESVQTILEISGPFAKQLRSIRRALDVGTSQEDFNARAVKLADTLDEIDGRLGQAETLTLRWSGEDAVKHYLEAGKEWSGARTETQFSSVQATHLSLRDIELKGANQAADQFLAEYDRLKQK